MATDFSGIERSEAIKPPQSRVGAIFFLWGIGEPTKTKANVQGSNAGRMRKMDPNYILQEWAVFRAHRATRQGRLRCASRNSASARTSSGAFYSDGDGTRPIEDRNVARRAAEQDDPRLRHAAVTVVDHEVIGAPEPQCTGREIQLPRDGGQG